jgi:hypothetical protein
MPNHQSIRQQRRRHRLTILQIWVATSGCWTTVGVALPHNQIAVWVSLLVGVALAVTTTIVSNVLEARVEDTEHHVLPAFVAAIPTLLGLMAYAYATYADAGHGTAISGTLINPIADMSSDKSVITQVLLVSFLLEQTLPSLGKTLRKLTVKILKAAREWFKKVVIEAVRENVSSEDVIVHAAGDSSHG